MGNEEENKNAVVILSGGMDSTTLLYDVIDHGYKVYAISFDYEQRHLKELSYAAKTCEALNVSHKIVDLSGLNSVADSVLTRDSAVVPKGHYTDESMKQTVVPNRNMVLIALATSYAISIGAYRVYYGAHAGDHDIYFDCRPEFVDALGAAVAISDQHPVKLLAPYIGIDKGDIAKRGVSLNVDYSKTWTCYEGCELACGKCGACVERLEAFDKAGIVDPIKYKQSS